MNKIKKIISNYRISFPVFCVTFGIFLTLYVIDKYSDVVNNSTFLVYGYMLSMIISILFFTFIFLHATFKYTGWSAITGILSGIIACIYLRGLIFAAVLFGGSFSAGLLFLIPIILGGYFIGALVSVLIKAIFSVFKKS